ncbi:ABC transporter ATP-binding protein [Chloroflexales bacterium ZM16-3]|nr:ABC transporter ATP-binding protein [Chloroflexales bacterium ZM16-3]
MGITGGLSAEEYDRSYSDTQLIRRIAAYFRPQARRVILVSLMVALASLAATVVPLVISRGIDALSGSPSAQLLLGLSGLVTVLGGVGWVFNFVRQRYAARAVGGVVLALRQDAFRAVMRRDMSFYDQNASGRVVSRVTSDTQDFATVVTLTVDLLSQLVLVGVISAVMLAVNWRLALVTLSLGPVVVVVATVFRRLARRAMQQYQRAQATVNASIQETISGMAVAKGFRQEAALYADFQATNALAYRVQLTRVAVFGSIFPLLNTISGLGTSAVIYVGGLLVIGGSVSVGDWYLFVQGLTIFFYPITSIASFWSQFQQGLAASERVFALIDAEPRVVQEADENPGRLRGEIAFEGMEFAYGGWGLGARGWAGQGSESTTPNPHTQTPSPQPPTPNPQVLHDFSLHIRAGERLAIVGHTGAGKSSLVKLIMRFYEFQGGRLLVDGRDIRRLDLAAYRRQIGLVPQAPFLFSGTVADNIRYGRPGASDEEVAAAAGQIGAGGWVADLPEGLGTDVGERGARISLGQRQLVAMARVLLQDPAIILLDEATASIDPFTEVQVQAGLETAMRGRTSVVIAHRLSTVRAADRIIVMRHGQVIEQGDHAGLLEVGGHYAELYSAYFRHQDAGYRPW